jgi:endonuclease/exonuclease/phosphatase family metal-dependent hydrolase
MKIKILSWNIWVDGHFDEITRFIKNSNADIICLQEVKDNDSERDTIGLLEKLGYNYAFASTLQTWDGRKYKQGPAVFSKFTIKNSKTYMLSEENVRVAVRADINVGDQTLHVFSTHLIHTHQKPSEIQEEQARNLIELIPNESSILAGDFNATPESEAIKLLNSVFVDTDKTSSPTWSVYKAGCELCSLNKITIRLDYIFTTKDVGSSSFAVGQSRGSDHLPISTIIEV